MRLTLLFLALTVLAVALGVFFINMRVSVPEPIETREYSAPFPATAEVAEPMVAEAVTEPPLYVSACIDSGNRCRCLDKQGRDLNLENKDCRAMLKLVNGK